MRRKLVYTIANWFTVIEVLGLCGYCYLITKVETLDLPKLLLGLTVYLMVFLGLEDLCKRKARKFHMEDFTAAMHHRLAEYFNEYSFEYFEDRQYLPLIAKQIRVLLKELAMEHKLKIDTIDIDAATGEGYSNEHIDVVIREEVLTYEIRTALGADRICLTVSKTPQTVGIG